MTTAEIVRWVIDTFEGHLYTDDPVDTGGATKYGITLRTLRYYRRKMSGDARLAVTKDDVRNLALDEAVACGVEVFAAEPRITEIADWHLRLMVYDYGFHSGPPRAIRALQEAVSADQDGVLGPITLSRVAAYGVPTLLALQVLTTREEFMQGIMEHRQTQRRFLFGWWRRTTALQRLIIS